MIAARPAAFICVRCTQRITQRPTRAQGQLRHYVSRLRTSKDPKAPPKSGKIAEATQPTAHVEPPRQPPRRIRDEKLSDHPWATTFTTAGWIISGTLFFGMLGLYGTQYYLSLTRPLPDTTDQKPIDLTAVYDDYAPHFDEDVDRTEYWNGIMSLRSRLVKQARGDVLESAAGTGRNSEYYVKSKVKSLTIVDKSKGMLEIAAHKWPKEREGEDWTGKVRFAVGDVEDAQMIRAQSGIDQFDTVIQTLGLCSTDDPDGLMKSLTKLVKPGGKILLLEHGQGYFEGLNRMLDRSAHAHATQHGCWWNRDIGAIVGRSGMETVEITRTWRSAGTNWYVILRKPAESDTIENQNQKSSS